MLPLQAALAPRALRMPAPKTPPNLGGRPITIDESQIAESQDIPFQADLAAAVQASLADTSRSSEVAGPAIKAIGSGELKAPDLSGFSAPDVSQLSPPDLSSLKVLAA